MRADLDPARQRFIKALQATPRATRRQMAERARLYWLEQVEKARERVEKRQRAAAGLEGVLDPSCKRWVEYEREGLPIARRWLQTETARYYALLDETGGEA
jgi:hypothetical protein